VFYRGSIEALPGEIETLPSGSLRVRVYDRIDPVTRKRRHLTEIIPPGPGAAKEAEKARACRRRSMSSATRAPARPSTPCSTGTWRCSVSRTRRSTATRVCAQPHPTADRRRAAGPDQRRPARAAVRCACRVGPVRRRDSSSRHHDECRSVRRAHVGEGHQDSPAATDRRADGLAPGRLPAALRSVPDWTTCRCGVHLLAVARRSGLDQARHNRPALRADVHADRLGHAHPPAPALLRHGADRGWRRRADLRRSTRSRRWWDDDQLTAVDPPAPASAARRWRGRAVSGRPVPRPARRATRSASGGSRRLQHARAPRPRGRTRWRRRPWPSS